MIQRANEITISAYSAEQDAEEILDEAERRIFEIADKRTRSGFTPLSDLVRDSFDTIEKLQSQKGMVTGVPTGFTDSTR